MIRRLAVGLLVGLMSAGASGEVVERWGLFEAALKHTGDHKNPFTDVTLAARFTCGDKTVDVAGFHDGDKTWKVRFMPPALGKWTYKTKSNDAGLDGKTGSFECGPPSKNNHGPVRVRNKFYLAYEDGAPYFQVGTTCYAWVHQGDAMEAQTLATLAKSPFNKIRMCVFPKSYAYNKNEPKYYCFPRKDGKNDYTRFEPAFWAHLEKRIGQLMALGIEADLILFHPYDRWGYKSMDRRSDDRYLRYCVARLAAFRNVWWSFANEYDLMLKIPTKKMADWDRFFQVVQKADPYDHMRGIHNCRQWYDHTRPWVHHCSIQSSNFRDLHKLRAKYNKPLVFDECKYEGNIPQGWGKISAKEMTRRFWLGTMQGAYVGHGETYKHPKDILWWSKGGVLHGQSPERIAFLKKLMTSAPVTFEQLAPDHTFAPGTLSLVSKGRYYLVYFDLGGSTSFELAGKEPYKVDGIDTWKMTVSALASAGPGKFTFAAPTGGYLLRLATYKPGEARRPVATIKAAPTEGKPPLKVQFTGPAKLTCKWDFGDGGTSAETSPVHTYARGGVYNVTLVAADAKSGATARAHAQISVEVPAGEPIVRVGVAGADRPVTKAEGGKIKRGKDGTLDFGDSEPWKWLAVGEAPLRVLEGLKSFTICGWANATSFQTGRGGNRIAFNLNNNRSGFDLVVQKDGRLRLAVNQWPDRVRNDSSPGKIRKGQWVFFAVTYNTTKRMDNVKWYFGDADTPAKLDKATKYNNGPTGTGSGRLTIGNYNETLHGNGKDRQFRGRLRGIAIFGSRVGSGGALSLSAIRGVQKGGK